MFLNFLMKKTLILYNVCMIKSTNKTNNFKCIFLCFCAIAVNMGVYYLSLKIDLPFNLNGIATVFVAATGGYLPGILVGFFSSMSRILYGISNIYFVVADVAVAIVTAYFQRKGFFEKIYKAVFVAFPLAIVFGVLRTTIYYLINNFSFEIEYFNRIINYFGFLSISDNIFLNLSIPLFVQTISYLIIIIIDFVLMKTILKGIGNSLQLTHWNQNPLSLSDTAKFLRIKTGQNSLETKLVGTIIAIIFFITIAIVDISFNLYKNVSIEQYTQLGVGASKLVASIIDGDKIDEYIKNGEAVDDYLKIEKQLESIRDTSDEIEYVYVYRILEDGCHVVFDLDTEELEGGLPGDIVEFDESFNDYIPDLLAGNRINPIETNDTYGWLLTAYEPIKDSNGKTSAYACVDISMNQVTLNEISFIAKTISLFLSFMIIFLAIGLWLIEYYLVLPINTMAHAAENFVYKNETDRQDSVDKFKDLNITTGDEVENLYHSFSITIEDTVKFIADIQKQSEVINKMQSGLILVLADMVENRDKCTGDHVRKTAAYCRVILNELRKEGKFKDILTDEYIEDVVNSAPLHDVGKITIPDAILNKPGKLTDEEYQIMQNHTLAGSDIIQQAIELVASDSTYLKEAKNLAACHHERWDGTGYPRKLKGEEIPLSARIMAVADVFDALSSKRSYKEPFTFEKAMDIIKEESGTHFDPEVVDAFVQAQNEVREVHKVFMGASNNMAN